MSCKSVSSKSSNKNNNKAGAQPKTPYVPKSKEKKVKDPNDYITLREYTSFDDGLCMGWTYTTSALPGHCEPPNGNYIESSSSVSVSTAGPIETKSYTPKVLYKIRKRIIVDTLKQTDAYKDITDNIRGLVAPRILSYQESLEKIKKNIADPVAILNAFGIEAKGDFSGAFQCINRMKDIIVVSQAAYNMLVKSESFSLDFLLRSFYQGMGLKIIIDKDGETVTVTDIIRVFEKAQKYKEDKKKKKKNKDNEQEIKKNAPIEIPGDRLLSFSQNIENTLIPNSYAVYIDKDGRLSSRPTSPKESSVQYQFMLNRDSIIMNKYSNMSLSVAPPKAIEFGMFKMVTLDAIHIENGSSAPDGSNKNSNEEDSEKAGVKIKKFKDYYKVIVNIPGCTKKTITLPNKKNKVHDGFERKKPSNGEPNYNATWAAMMNTFVPFFEKVSVYESLYMAAKGVAVFLGSNMVKPWDRIKFKPPSIEGYNMRTQESETFEIQDYTQEHIVTNVDEIIENGIERTVVHFMVLDPMDI